MTVVITFETISGRYAGLDKRIWANFPSIGWIDTDEKTTRLRTLTFDLGDVPREEFQKFLDSEGLTANFQEE